MKIVPYHSDYLKQIIHVWESASKVGHPFLSDEFLSLEKQNIPTVYLPNGTTWVAEIDNKVVGFSILHDNEIGALFVLPEYHGQGIGYALVEKAHEAHVRLIVEVFKENAIGNEFYFRVGFKFVREYFHKESGRVMLCLEHSLDN